MKNNDLTKAVMKTLADKGVDIKCGDLFEIIKLAKQVDSKNASVVRVEDSIMKKVRESLFGETTLTEDKVEDSDEDDSSLDECEEKTKKFILPDEFFTSLNIAYEVDHGNLDPCILDEIKSHYCGVENIRFYIDKKGGQLGIQYIHKDDDIVWVWINKENKEIINRCTRELFRYRFYEIRDIVCNYTNGEMEIEESKPGAGIINIYAEKKEKGFGLGSYNKTPEFTKFIYTRENNQIYIAKNNEIAILAGEYITYLFFQFILNN